MPDLCQVLLLLTALCTCCLLTVLPCSMDLCDSGWMVLVSLVEELARLVANVDVAGVMGMKRGTPPFSPKHGVLVHSLLNTLLCCRTLRFAKFCLPQLLAGDVVAVSVVGGDADVKDVDGFSKHVGGTVKKALL
jgi:hypothetical protein